jgi:hypothetical protein
MKRRVLWSLSGLTFLVLVASGFPRGGCRITSPIDGAEIQSTAAQIACSGEIHAPAPPPAHVVRAYDVATELEISSDSCSVSGGVDPTWFWTAELPAPTNGWPVGDVSIKLMDGSTQDEAIVVTIQ